ncbi:hypothetical protein [Candidatus Clostridium stratigraminis]|uniref:Uncharacterized protein n=1 Tax=Candidatus Clostridium stratigraminis TaxID=3381661 RepID=A0ABW8T9U6_9CLOT
MTDQNMKDNENLNDNKLLGDKLWDSKYRIGVNILTIFILFASLFIFQLTSYITNIDFLAPFPGLNFIIMPICIAITIMTVYILNKTRYMVKVLNLINRLINYIKKYQFVYRILKFIYKHPLISSMIVGIIWGIIKNIGIT